MMQPLLRAAISSHTACVHRKTLFRFKSMIWSQYSSVMSASVCRANQVAGVVHQNVNAPPLFAHRRHQGMNLMLARNVGANRQSFAARFADGFHRLLRAFLILEVVHSHAGAFARHGFRRRPADAA